MEKPKLNMQGLVVVEDKHDGEFLVMFPTGEIEIAVGRAAAQRKADRWLKRNRIDQKAINVGLIRWQ
jgi:hypothetical protein